MSGAKRSRGGVVVVVVVVEDGLISSFTFTFIITLIIFIIPLILLLVQGLQVHDIQQQNNVQSSPTAGDHIYVWRERLMYTHHGIVDVNGEVIHYGTDTSGDQKGVVGKTTLKEFLDGGTLGMFRYGVSSQDVLWDFNGTCSSREKDSAEKVVERAKSLLGKGDYNVLTNNCDKNSLYCMTGIMETSVQVIARLKVVVSLVLLCCFLVSW